MSQHPVERPNEYKKFAAENLIDVAKLLITLSSAFLAFTASLISYVSNTTKSINNFDLVIISWITLVLGIIIGVLGIGSIITTAQENSKFDIDRNHTNKYFIAQQILFFISVGTFIYFIIVNL